MQLTEDTIIESARQAIDIEIQGLNRVKDRLGPEFVEAVRLILHATGRVVVTGIGKSGLVGRKISATLASTGTPSVFLHPVEAMHGDLGMVMSGDVVLAISNSGETAELNALLPAFRARNIPVISLTGGLTSTMSHLSKVVIDTGVEKEACALGLAPTASTTAALAVGDALSVVLLKLREFSEKDFRRNHPSGSLGERLKVSVGQVMLTGPDIPVVKSGTSMEEAMKELDAKRLGAVLVLDGEERVTGIVTDGDLRRAVLRFKGELGGRRVEDVMTHDPKRVTPDTMAADALSLMEHHLITVLPVVQANARLVGIVHLHDLLGKGEFKFI